MTEDFRHIHTDIAGRLQQMDPPPVWVRHITTQVPRNIVINERTSLPESYVELWTSLLLERPGFPPMAGVATQTQVPEDEEEECELTLYYFTHYELGDATLTSDVFYDPGRVYHEDEEMVDFPEWVLYSDSSEETDAEQETTMAADPSGSTGGEGHGQEDTRAQ